MSAGFIIIWSVASAVTGALAWVLWGALGADWQGEPGNRRAAVVLFVGALLVAAGSGAAAVSGVATATLECGR